MTIETNYSIGQEVYFMHDNKVQTAKIIDATKEDLLKSL